MYQAMKIGSVAGSIPAESITFFVEVGHEVSSMVILSLPLIQVCQFLAQECPQVLVNLLEDSACLGKVWLGKLTSST